MTVLTITGKEGKEKLSEQGTAGTDTMSAATKSTQERVWQEQTRLQQQQQARKKEKRKNYAGSENRSPH